MGATDRMIVHRFPDNIEKLSPPILQLDEVEFYYSRDQRLFSGLDLSADLDSRICIVRVVNGPEGAGPLLSSPHQSKALILCCRLLPGGRERGREIHHPQAAHG